MGYLGAGFKITLESGLSVYAEGRYSVHDYSEQMQPDGSNRSDNRYEAKAHISNKNWTLFGFMPLIQYEYVLNESNVETSSYDAHSVTMTLSQNF